MLEATIMVLLSIDNILTGQSRDGTGGFMLNRSSLQERLVKQQCKSLTTGEHEDYSLASTIEWVISKYILLSKLSVIAHDVLNYATVWKVWSYWSCYVAMPIVDNAVDCLESISSFCSIVRSLLHTGATIICHRAENRSIEKVSRNHISRLCSKCMTYHDLTLWYHTHSNWPYQ